MEQRKFQRFSDNSLVTFASETVTGEGHPAILAYAIGNEIPAPTVRWYGARRVEDFLHRLYRAAKAEDPAALVTYVNYPTSARRRSSCACPRACGWS